MKTTLRLLTTLLLCMILCCCLSVAARADSFNINATSLPDNAFRIHVSASLDMDGDKIFSNEEATDNGMTEGNFQFEDMTTADTFNTPYEDMNDAEKAKVTDMDPHITTNKDGSIKMTGVQFDTFESYKVASGVNFEDSVTVPNEYLDRQETSVTLKTEWIKMQAPGYYTIWGIKISDSMPVKIGSFQVNKGDYSGIVVSPAEYIKPAAYGNKGTGGVAASGTDIALFDRFGVASVTGGYTHILGVNEYRLYGAPADEIELEDTYLRNLEDGEYYLIGFPSGSSTSNQVRLGGTNGTKFIIRSGKTGGTYSLTPDYQMWYSGADPLSFYSEIHDAAGNDGKNKSYGGDVISPDVDIDVIVPQIIISTRSNMSAPVSIDDDQYLDLGYGYIMLGTNFLNSLSPEETCYMQVIDARTPDLVRSNVVSFYIGPTLLAIDTDKHVINSTRSLRFQCSSPVSAVYVDNVQLTDAADFDVSQDGKTVTLSFAFLNRRIPDTYTLKVRTTNGDYPSATFQINGFESSMTLDEYIKPTSYGSMEGSGGVSATATEIGAMECFGVASVTGSYTHVLNAAEYSLTDSTIMLETAYLNELDDDEYYLIAFPHASDTSNQVRIGKFSIKSPPPLVTVIDETSFPDPAFRRYVLSNIDLDFDGVLNRDEVDRVSTISCPNYGIGSLKGIEFFDKLDRLSCQSNSLTDLDLSTCPALTTLYCGNNALTKLSLNACTSITLVNCSDNALIELDLSSCSALTVLDCSENLLSGIDLSRNPMLRSLTSYGNLMRSLDLSANLALAALYCQNNLLTELQVSGCAALKALTCQNNALTELDLNGCDALLTLIKSVEPTVSDSVVTYGGYIDYYSSLSLSYDEGVALHNTIPDPNLILPASLTVIEPEAFVGGAFVYVVVPEQVTEIGSRAFADCPNLRYVEIQGLATEIAPDAFENVHGLTILDRSGIPAVG